LELLGFFPLIVLLGTLRLPFRLKILSLAFATPLLLAFLTRLTIDIVMNHKYIIISVILLNIFAAYFIYQLFSARKWLAKALGVCFLLLMTVTGVVDLITLCNINRNYICIREDTPVLVWTKKNTRTDAVFLTAWYSHHPILLAGRKIFYGWPYYAWSAGYDTYGRDRIVKRIYEGGNIQEVKTLLKQNKISYVVIDDDNRTATNYRLNEKFFQNNFQCIYRNPDRNITIYDTRFQPRL